MTTHDVIAHPRGPTGGGTETRRGDTGWIASTREHTTPPAGIDGLLGRLHGVRQTGPDRWTARCPAHDDRDPSLSIRDAGDRVLIRCHAGCTAAAIVAAVGLELRDLYARPLDRGTRRAMAQAGTTHDLEAALDHELTIMALTLGRRVVDRQIPRRAMPEGWRPMPPGAWERELQAARRVLRLLPMVYGSALVREVAA